MAWWSAVPLWHDIVESTSATLEFGQCNNSESRSTVVMAWCWTPLPNYSIWMISNTLYVFVEGMWESFHVSFEPQPLRHGGIILWPKPSAKISNSETRSTVVLACWWTLLSIHSLTAYELSQTYWICLKRMRESFPVGLEPQPLRHDHYIIQYSLRPKISADILQ